MSDDEVATQAHDNRALANHLYERWNAGESKSQLEIQTWQDATSHGRRFDRFIRSHLGVSTTTPSRQTTTIESLSRQILLLGGVPDGVAAQPWQTQVQHARESCLAALRVWNDPTARFRTGAFSLLIVATWNALCIAILEKAGQEWRARGADGHVVTKHGVEQALDTMQLVRLAFPSGDTRSRALFENVKYWLDLRNCVAHRHLPAVDTLVIPEAQAGLMNIDEALRSHFGDEYTLADHLTVPLQLKGFRDPGVLASRKALQAALPLDVQILLNRNAEIDPVVAADPAYQVRIAFVPVVPASGRPDAVAYFVRPGEVPPELEETIERFVVIPKILKPSVWFRPSDVAAEVQRRTGYVFHATPHHSTAAERLGARPPRGEPARTLDIALAEYVSSFKQYQYTQAWIDLLVRRCSTEEGFKAATGRIPIPAHNAPDVVTDTSG